MSSGIYKISCVVDEKVYIGLSANIDNRLRFHKNRLKTNSHKNKHLQNAWNRYGEDRFKFEVIEMCDIDQMNEKEKHWISFYRSDKREFGFNKTAGGEFGRVSDEINQQRIDKLKLQTISKEQRIKISKTLSGRKQSPELVEKRAQSNRICDPQIEAILAKEYLESGLTKQDLAKKYKLTFYAVRGALRRQGVGK